MKVLRGSTFLGIDDESSNLTYFKYNKDNGYRLLLNNIMGRMPNSAWHFYEVMQQTTEPYEGLLSEFNDIKALLNEYVSPDDFFKFVIYAIRIAPIEHLKEASPKRITHFMELLEIYVIYKNTGILTFNYDKEKMKSNRRIKYSNWPQEDINRYEYLMGIIDINFHEYYYDREVLIYKEVNQRIEEMIK